MQLPPPSTMYHFITELSTFRCGLLTTLEAYIKTTTLPPIQSLKHGIKMASAMRTPYQYEEPWWRMSLGQVLSACMARRGPGVFQTSIP